jgi:hypothetical protein
MLLVNMSNLGFVNYYGLNYPWVSMTPQLDYEYEHTLIPFVGFNDSDFEEVRGNLILRSQFDLKIRRKQLRFVKSNKIIVDQILFLYSFPVINGGTFGSFEGSKIPEMCVKFSSGNPESGYFHEMMFLLNKDTRYEILYHSEDLIKVSKIEMFWDSKNQDVSVYVNSIL